MTDIMQRRRDTLDLIIMLAVVTLAVIATRVIGDVAKAPLIVAVTIVTARGAWELLIRSAYLAIRKVDVLLRLYWGSLYLDGLWSYTYHRDGRRYHGVWRISQDDRTTRVLGFGLNDDGSIRTLVRSVSPLLEEQGAWFVLNDRVEFPSISAPSDPLVAVTQAPQVAASLSSQPTYSKTTMIFDGRGAIHRFIATTSIFGGPSSGQLHADVEFDKRPDAESLHHLIEEMRTLG